MFVFSLFVFYIYMGVLPVSGSVLHMHAVLIRARRGHQIPRTRLNGCKPPFIWESSLGPVEEQRLLLTTKPVL